MLKSVHAVYINGVFRPIEPVDLPHKTAVVFEPRVLADAPSVQRCGVSDGLAKVYEILGRRHSSGFTDTAARHNEHQP